MRLLVITFDPPENVGGVEGRAGAYARELLTANHFVEVIALGASYAFSTVGFHGTTLHRYPSSVLASPRCFGAAVKEVNRKSVDSVFLLSGALTLFGVLMLLFCRMTGRGSVAFIYGKDILGASKSPAQRLLFLAAGLLARRMAVNSRYTSGLLPGFLAHKTRVLYPGVDPQIAKGIQHGASRSGTILFVGRLVERKGADDLIRAFASLRKEHPGLGLEIVGDGPDRARLTGIARDLGVGDAVRFLGTLRGPSLHERYLLADVFAMPSRSAKDDVEGFGTVFLEAGLFGKPSVGTWSGGIPEAVLDGKTGLLVPERDVGKLREALRELLTNEEESESLGERARERVLSSFTWEACTSSLLGLFGGEEARKR